MMTRDEMLSDFYMRATSRKLWLTLLAIGFAVWGHQQGTLSGVEFQQAITAAILGYFTAEGVVDAVAAYKPKPSGPDQVVSVDASTQTGSTAKPAPLAAPKRVRPSRARPKVVTP